MAINYNYTTLCDCNAKDGWTASDNTTVEDKNDAEGVGGPVSTESLEITTSDKDDWEWCQYTCSDEFDLSTYDLSMWFRYTKGKSAQYLRDHDACHIRLYDNNDNRAEWNFGGHLDLPNKWKILTCSGTEGIVDSSGSYDITRFKKIELRLYFVNANDGDNEIPLKMDWWKIGNAYTVTEGDSDTPNKFVDIVSWSDDNAIGMIEKTGSFVNMLAGLIVGDTSTDTYFKDTGLLIYNSQQSNEVAHDITLYDKATFILGDYIVGENGDEYSINGCTIQIADNRESNIEIKEGGVFKLYDSKVVNYTDINIGDANNNASEVDIQYTTFTKNNTIKLYSTNVSMYENVFYYPRNDIGCEIYTNPVKFLNNKFHHHTKAIIAYDDITLKGLYCSDNTTDIAIADTKEVTIIDSNVDDSKVISN